MQEMLQKRGASISEINGGGDAGNVAEEGRQYQRDQRGRRRSLGFAVGVLDWKCQEPSFVPLDDDHFPWRRRSSQQLYDS